MLKEGVDDVTILDRMRGMSVSKHYVSLNAFACGIGITFKDIEGTCYPHRDGAKIFVFRLRDGKVDGMDAINLRDETVPNDLGIYYLQKRHKHAVYGLNSESKTGVELKQLSVDWYFYKTSVSFSFLNDI